MINLFFIILLVILIIILFFYFFINFTENSKSLENNSKSLEKSNTLENNIKSFNNRVADLLFKNDVKQNNQNNKKTCVIYAYHETDQYAIRNLLFFLENGLIDSTNIVYYIIINGSTKLILKNTKNVKFIFRENKNYDFGAWGYFFENIKDSLNFDYYIFLNSSVIGPILPLYLNNIINWTDIFTLHINNNIKIVGCTTNYEKQKHIQSYCFCVDKIGLIILLNKNIFKIASDDKMDFIDKGEIKMLKYINESGYKGMSFESVQNKIDYNADLTQSYIYKEYTGLNTQIFETMFLKPRLIDEKYIKFLTKFYGY